MHVLLATPSCLLYIRKQMRVNTFYSNGNDIATQIIIAISL